MKLRSKLFALVGAGALVMGIAGTAFAQTGNQTNVAWNANASDCTGGPDGDFTVDEGQVAWIFVHTGVTGSGTLTAEFDNAGEVQAASYQTNGVGVVKYMIVTDAPDTLLSFSDTLGGGVLNLSHTCYNTETSSTSESSTTEFTSSEESTSTSEESSTTSFVSSEESTSTAVLPTEPNTATTGTSGSSTMSNGLWMLLAGLGVVGGSVLVLMPSRAKGKR
jgi:hypothetical protein